MAACVLWPTALISYPHLVFQTRNQTKKDAAIAKRNDALRGEYLILIPNNAAKSLKLGSHNSFGSAIVWGPICFMSRITSTNK